MNSLIARDRSIDFIRYFASFLVVMLHVSAQKWGSWGGLQPTNIEWIIMNFFNFFTRSSVPLFFMISGALFLSKKELSIQRLFKNNILKLLLIYFITSFLYAIDTIITNQLVFSPLNIIYIMIQGKYHLWFLKTLIGIYLMFPIIYKTVNQNVKIEKYALLIFFVFSILRPTCLQLPYLPNSIVNLLNIIDMNYFNYLGYAILGHYLYINKLQYNKPIKYFICFFTIFICAFGFNTIYAIYLGYQTDLFLDNFSIFTFVEAICIFKYFLSLKFTSNFNFSDYTLGIYLSHIFILEKLDSLYNINALTFTSNALISIPLLTFLVYLLSFIITAIFQKTIFFSKKYYERIKLI